MGPTLNDPFTEVIRLRELEYHYDSIVCMIVCDPNEAIDIYREVVDLWRWSVREVLLYLR